jgi:hypothetical protein
MSPNTNLFDTIASAGSDLDFVPRVTSDFRPTEAPAGSREKIKVLRWRLEHGFPLFHKLDVTDAGNGYQRTGNLSVLHRTSGGDSFA